MGLQPPHTPHSTQEGEHNQNDITPVGVIPPHTGYEDLDESDSDIHDLVAGSDKEIFLAKEAQYQTFINEYSDCKTTDELDAKHPQHITMNDAQLLDYRYYCVQGQYWRSAYKYPVQGNILNINNRYFYVTEVGLLTFNMIIVSCSCGMCNE